MTIVYLLLYVVALVCFLAATFNVSIRISLVALGLALVTLVWVIQILRIVT